MMDNFVLNNETSFPPVDDLIESFVEYGLVEVLLDKKAPFWNKAYIIDVESTSEGFYASVILAVNEEKPQISLSTLKNVYKIPLDQVRLILKYKWDSKPTSKLINLEICFYLIKEFLFKFLL